MFSSVDVILLDGHIFGLKVNRKFNVSM